MGTVVTIALTTGAKIGVNALVPGSSAAVDFAKAGYEFCWGNYIGAGIEVTSGVFELVTNGCFGAVKAGASEAAKSASTKAAKETAKSVTKSIGGNTAKTIAKENLTGAAKKAVVGTAIKTAKAATKEIGKEYGEEIGKDLVKEAVKHGEREAFKMTSRTIGHSALNSIVESGFKDVGNQLTGDMVAGAMNYGFRKWSTTAVKNIFGNTATYNAAKDAATDVMADYAKSQMALQTGKAGIVSLMKQF